jgi:hypothetical protein
MPSPGPRTAAGEGLVHHLAEDLRGVSERIVSLGFIARASGDGPSPPPGPGDLPGGLAPSPILRGR